MANTGFNQSGKRHSVSKILDGEILGPEDEKRKDQVRVNFWQTLKKAARVIPFSSDLVAAYFCAMDPQTPTRVRVILFGALAYFIMPMDSIPDFLILFGFSDDAAVLLTAITAVRSSITPAHYQAAQEALEETA
jgi:uncharacterized membrane protein YkvA (DUF1232 family)